MDSDLTAVASENYSRVYSVMVNAQMLCELEEIIQYKLVPERRSAIKDMWWKRLKVRVMSVPEITSHVRRPSSKWFV